MNRLLGFVSAGVLVTAIAVANVRAQIPAVVNGDHLNVRSRPALSGEVITQLARGQVVTILEEGLRAPGVTDTASEWVRIELPALTHVWVSAGFVDPTANTVKPKRLNVRAGPGEEYGVLGTLSEGTAVQKVGERKGWLEIEAPAGLSAFVAAGYLQKTVVAPPAAPAPAAPAPSPTNNVPPQPDTTNVPAQTPPPQPAAATPQPASTETEVKPATETTPAVAVAPAAPAESTAEKPAPPVESPTIEKPKDSATAPATEKAVTEAIPQPSTEKPTSETTPPPEPEPATPKPMTPAPTVSTPASTNVTAAPLPAATAPTETVPETATAPKTSEPAPAAPAPIEVTPVPAATETTPFVEPDQPPAKRIVRREGTVRATLSFQAPTPFELRAPDTGATMDYLLPASTNINIKTFWGARVIVTGQEAIDSRWPNTPVIKVEKIELAP